MEIDVYSSPEQKARAKAESETIRAHCSGPLCGEADIKEALQTANGGHPVLAIFLTAFKLSPEFRDRQSHPLLEFAQIMTSSAPDNGWIVDENLMPVRLSGRHAYRLLVHNAIRPDAKASCMWPIPMVLSLCWWQLLCSVSRTLRLQSRT
jgi:hypothetical protein